jgi:type IV secretory pathway TraG/TraD family ATPase VirD4
VDRRSLRRRCGAPRYSDDRHVTLISGTRGDKGAGIIVPKPKLCKWRGSMATINRDLYQALAYYEVFAP